MSATCNFCKRQFGNAQGVRAHLKSCTPYRESRDETAARRTAAARQPPLGSQRLRRGSVGSPFSEDDAPFDPQPQFGDVDDSGREQTEPSQDQRRGDQQEPAAPTRPQSVLRRAAIQKVKDQVVTNWYSGIYPDAELKSRLLQAIERTFANLQVEDLPHEELVSIAVGIRDPIAREFRLDQEYAERLAGERTRLIQHGRNYAAIELRSVEGLELSERLRIEARAARELEDVQGDESQEDIEDLVDEIFDDEGIGWDDEDD